MPQARPLQARLLARSNASGRPANSSGIGDVFQRRHGRDQVERLEHDADMVAAEAGQLVLVQSAQILPATRSNPLVGRSSPAMIIIMVDLPDPDGPTTLTVSPRLTVRSMPRRMLTGPRHWPALDDVGQFDDQVIPRCSIGLRHGFSDIHRMLKRIWLVRPAFQRGCESNGRRRADAGSRSKPLPWRLTGKDPRRWGTA